MSKIFEIPSEIKLNHITYKTIFVKNLKDSEGDDLLGMYDSSSQTIKICTQIKDSFGNEVQISEEMMSYTYLHELGHAYSFHSGMEDSEAIAQTIANFLMDFFASYGQ